MPETPLDRLWKEYERELADIDDLTLARWMAQTLSQLAEKSWRVSHPLMALYRLLGQMGHDRGIWLKRLATPPPTYIEAGCCRAPLLPLFTRDVLESGLICQHCGETAIPFEDLPEGLQTRIRTWAEAYGIVHGVAHWEDDQRRRCSNYDEEFERAAKKAETLLGSVRTDILPELLDLYGVVVWEDHDECLEVRPEDVEP